MNVEKRQPPAADALLATAPPAFSVTEIAGFVERNYGIRGSLKPLTSERDQNFAFASQSQGRFIVKITNPAEDPLVTDLQTKALIHIASVDPRLPVPRMQATVDGEYQAHIEDPQGRILTVRVLTFLEGVPFHQAPRSAAQMANLGATLASLGSALRSFFHPAAGHYLQWDIKNAGDLHRLIALVKDADRRTLVEQAYRRFTDNVEPRLKHLRAQIIHNDMNPYNMLVGRNDPDRIVGVFDFGDMVHTALINDLAVCASYHVVDGPDPLARVEDLLRAYNRIAPLEPIEIELLPDLIAARHLTTVLVTNWRAETYPENRAYILRNAPASWLGLKQLMRLDRPAMGKRLRDVCREIANVDG